MKVCSICAAEKSKSEFYKHATTADRLDPRCKECVNANYNRLYDVRVHEAKRVSIKECRHRFKAAIDKPAKVWDSHADIPDLLAALEAYQSREKLAIDRMKKDGIDYKKYLAVPKQEKDYIDLSEYSCYSLPDEIKAEVKFPKHTGRASDGGWGKLCFHRRKVVSETP